ncbi:MarR family transcriptional regulator [Nodosilinea sp. FACHB-131]|jgi:DNA-binding MarR family transcriptional regulator|uniref:MarR family winged helix-turn-helix transcriptional regulator n=1 Tax=Cyanophyceae TaxID=3028117 RepID=UPI001684EEC8|nr:MarR family transcriptional regulator [Nodosilinea sp. FACHB-131]MBD1872768.1 MarR family transcriptional regulator [Nodosilinea sp. FACHB-131]MBW4462593.1 MarR family transcriptional regulator [Nodosilinea sp. WJT8-NPBG4]
MPSPSTDSDFLEQWRFVLAPYNLGYKIKLVSQLMYRNFLEQLEPHGLTPFHYLVLCCLWEEDGLSTSGIADKLKQLGATLTGVVDRMEDRKLVFRERDASDRRIIRIWLTDEGRALQTVLLPLGAKTLQQSTANISEADQATAMKVLDQIIHNLL